MDLAQRLAYKALLVSLKRSGLIDKQALRTIAEGLGAAADSVRTCDARAAEELTLLAQSLGPVMSGSYCCAALPSEMVGRDAITVRAGSLNA